MTQVYGNAPMLRGTTEDGSAMQRRLMQDLERQWLDDWGQAAKCQGIQDLRAGEDSKTAADAPGASESPSAKNVVNLAPSASSTVVPAAPAAASGSADAPLDASTGATVLSAATAWMNVEAYLPHSAGAAREPLLEGSLPSARLPNFKSAAATTSALLTDSLGATCRDETTTASRSSRVLPSRDAELSPNPMHLVMREVGADEVLASMRDAHLGTAESKVAAQELSRALMQAGYARIQVVVNGYQHRHVTEARDRTSSGSELPVEPNFSTPMNSQRVRHGN